MVNIREVEIVVEHIENEIYYHIQKKELHKNVFWKVGDSYFLGDTKNPFTRYFDIADLSNVGIEQIDDMIHHYQKFARETIFEEVRIKYFSNLPSRFHCLWVIPDKQDTIDYWKARLTASERQLVKLKLTGIIHKANQSFLELNRKPLDFNRHQAFKYWNGTTGNGSFDDEYLFQGFVEVIEVINLE